LGEKRTGWQEEYLVNVAKQMAHKKKVQWRPMRTRRGGPWLVGKGPSSMTYDARICEGLEKKALTGKRKDWARRKKASI